MRENHNFRRVWFSQMVSNLGDWFGVLAVYALIIDFSGSELLLGLIIVIKMMSFAVFSPFAGYIADRFDRRTLMIICDFGRGFAVLSFLLVRTPEMLWLIYLMTAIQMMFAAVFEPAKQSSIPNITTPNELVRANILSNLSWSIIFTSGMGLGGLATAAFGTDAVFIMNGLGYILSTIFIFRATIPHVRDEATMESLRRPIKGIMDGYKYLWKTGRVYRPALAKGTMTIFLGSLVYMLILISDQILMMGSAGLGLLYAARGAGTAVGPVVIRKLFPNERQWVTYMGIAMMVAGLSYTVVGLTSSLWLMLLFVFVAHSGSGANWVSSTVLLQQRAPDNFRGRVFSAEFLMFTVAQSISTLVVSLLLEHDIVDLQTAILGASAGLVITGGLWLLTIARKEKASQQAEAFAN
ncbi:MAG: MFS transporter [Balneolia bacterium]|nr:MFS transporter [Balneolia bacterium]